MTCAWHASLRALSPLNMYLSCIMHLLTRHTRSPNPLGQTRERERFERVADSFEPCGAPFSKNAKKTRTFFFWGGDQSGSGAPQGSESRTAPSRDHSPPKRTFTSRQHLLKECEKILLSLSKEIMKETHSPSGASLWPLWRIQRRRSAFAVMGDRGPPLLSA